MDMNELDLLLKNYYNNKNNKKILLEISKFFRLKGLNNGSYYFGKKYLKYFPNDLDGHYELSIVSFYVKDFNQGCYSCEKILLQDSDSHNIKESVKQNIIFYINPINILSKKKIEFSYNIRSNEKRFPMNTSIIRCNNNNIESSIESNVENRAENNGFDIIVRTVNYSYDQYGKYIFHYHTAISDNYLLHLSNDFQLCPSPFSLPDSSCQGKEHQINHSFKINNSSNFKGLEDMRLFLYNNEYWFTCVSPEINPKGYTQVCLGRLSLMGDVDVFLPLIGPDENRNQKNWLPLVYNNEILLIYSHKPFILLKPILIGDQKGYCPIWKEKILTRDLSDYRGSCSPIPYKKGYLYMIHQTIFKDNFYNYFNRFVYLNSNLEKIKLSKLFYFFYKGIEYCMGMEWNNQKNLIITVSKLDNVSYLCEIDRTEVEAMFKECEFI